MGDYAAGIAHICVTKLNPEVLDLRARLMRAAGANAAFLPMNKALAALKEHQLNAFLTSGDGGVGRRLWDFLPHFTAINYAMPVSIAMRTLATTAGVPAAARLGGVTSTASSVGATVSDSIL